MTNHAPFVHLRVHSSFSLAEGAIRPKDLIKQTKKYDMPAVAITDTSNLFGAMEFSLEAVSNGIQPILGAQIYLGDDYDELVLLVQSDEGYKNLSALLSGAYMDSDGSKKPFITWEKLTAHHAGLICLSGGVKGPIGKRILSRQNDEAKSIVKKLYDLFGNRFYIELQRHGTDDENMSEPYFIALADELNIPLVATNECFFKDPDEHEAHDALLCIAETRYVTEDNRRKVTQDHYFKHGDDMVELFADIPEAIHNTINIAKRCHFFLHTINPILPAFKTEAGRSEVEELTALSREGLEYRLNKFVFTDDLSEAQKEDIAKPYRDRLEFELNTIIQMGFPGYFLIVSDFIRWAKSQNIPVGPGRGSGAGSVVAWSLLITDLDPLRFGLLFERFLNPERVSMPDFDVDFCQDRRDEVINYVQQRYGFDRVAQIITFGQLKARAVVRDVGRVLQMPYGQVDKIAKLIPNNPANPMTLQQALDQDENLRLQRADEQIDKLISIALKLEGLNRHASTHAAGVVIGDRPLEQLVPLYRDPSSTMPVTQFNMKYVESAGLVKFDFLGLKTLTVVQKAAQLIDPDLDILTIPLDDQKSYEMISSGLSTGVFQLESAGMRDTLRKMKPNRFEDIIALVSLYRPGPMDNIPKYIDVKEGRLAADYLHPKLQPILEETYGIMVYQEQVMQAAQLLAGYTLGGADLLRRAMGKKIKSEMDAQRETFVKGAASFSQVSKARAEAIFEQIEKFAGYGFNKSHAAAYALIAYQTAWLKANHPVEFFTASMTLDMGNTDKLAVFKQALEQIQIPLLLPDINKSDVVFAVEGHAVRYALAAIKGVGEQAMNLVVAERTKNGEFTSLDNFLSRLDSKSINKKQFENLIAAGAFDNLYPNRASLHAAAEQLVHHAHALAQEKQSNQSSLFGLDAAAEQTHNSVAHLIPQIPDWGSWDRLSHEFDAIGFYLSAHPLDTRKQQLSRLGILSYADIPDYLGHKPAVRVQMAGVLLKKVEKVSQKSGNRFAFLTLSDSTGVYEVALYSEILQRVRNILEEGKAFLLSADVSYKDDQLRFTVQDIKPLEESLAGKVREIEIEIDNADAVKKMANILRAHEAGPIKIIINMKINDKCVKIKLPSGYHMTAPTKNALEQVKGVCKILEN